jgi:hypothetical protein
LSVSWESNPARLKASKINKYLVYKLKIYILRNKKGNLIQWTSRYTGLVLRKQPWHQVSTEA